MKRGTKCKLPVSIGMSLDDVEQIEFVFRQGDKTEFFLYPSEKAVRREASNIVDLIWDLPQTYYFDAGHISMDTRIHLKDFDWMPETDVVDIVMKRTLFEEVRDE